MNILHVVSEVAPLAKTGGLADVAAALPRALQQFGHDVRIILPRYRAIDAARVALAPALDHLSLSVASRHLSAKLLETVLPASSVPVYCVEQPACFDRDGLYQADGVDFPDNLERFSVLTQAILQAMPQLGWQPQVVHCHDWQTALFCAHLVWTKAQDPFWRSARSVLTVHNLAYQGVFPAAQWAVTNLPVEAFRMNGLEFYGQINCLKGGLGSAHAVTTVSPTYAREIRTPEFGCGLEGAVAARPDGVTGILNGIDVEMWNPQTDPHLAAPYRPGAVAGKALCKLALQERLGLAQHHVLVIGMIQRLVEQKGIDLLLEAVAALMALPVQLVILGTGDPAYAEAVAALPRRFPERLAVRLDFDEALAHQIEAGCDAFLMPSRFEPCGLNQMYSMRYGTIPIVRKVGGLADTVVDVSPATVANGTATGFVFEAYAVSALVEAVARAVAAFRDHALWQRIIRTAMQRDFSWARAAAAYVSVYERLLTAPPARQSASAARPSARPPFRRFLES